LSERFGVFLTLLRCSFLGRASLPLLDRGGPDPRLFGALLWRGRILRRGLVKFAVSQQSSRPYLLPRAMILVLNSARFKTAQILINSEFL